MDVSPPALNGLGAVQSQLLSCVVSGRRGGAGEDAQAMGEVEAAEELRQARAAIHEQDPAFQMNPGSSIIPTYGAIIFETWFANEPQQKDGKLRCFNLAIAAICHPLMPRTWLCGLN
eukprot:scaffold128702_cov49-Prasinocladus_malaysianus.AAC.3